MVYNKKISQKALNLHILFAYLRIYLYFCGAKLVLFIEVHN